jgi:hypothetical protein
LQWPEEAFRQIIDGKDLAESHRPVAFGWRTQSVLTQKFFRFPVVDIFVSRFYSLFAFVQPDDFNCCGGFWLRKFYPFTPP